jgi:hypothetical protein
MWQVISLLEEPEVLNNEGIRAVINLPTLSALSRLSEAKDK